MVEVARELLDRVGMAFVVANDASVMGSDETRVLVVRENTVQEFAGSKAALGGLVASELADELAGEPNR
jgi:phosphopantothenoylcysteine decarboxylase/phosphopantothenate--cysteine ligase